jgi:transcriptional regulator with XRE-family HTH domain
LATRNRSDKAPEPGPIYDWSTAGRRVKWLLDARFTDNRSEMARAIGFSPAAVGQVVSGSKPPGRRMLTAIVQKLGVDAGWLLEGKGEPFGAKAEAADAAVWMPVRDSLLPEPLPRELRELSDRTVVVPGYRPSTQYWFRLGRAEPVLDVPQLGFRKGDLLLMETDPARFPAEEHLLQHLCAVKSAPGEEPPVKLGTVEFDSGTYEQPRTLDVDTFEGRRRTRLVEGYDFRPLPDGKFEVVKRFYRKDEQQGRVEYVQVRRSTLGVMPRDIKYSDIVAVWTGILYRRGWSGIE